MTREKALETAAILQMTPTQYVDYCKKLKAKSELVLKDSLSPIACRRAEINIEYFDSVLKVLA